MAEGLKYHTNIRVNSISRNVLEPELSALARDNNTDTTTDTTNGSDFAALLEKANKLYAQQGSPLEKIKLVNVTIDHRAVDVEFKDPFPSRCKDFFSDYDDDAPQDPGADGLSGNLVEVMA